MSRRVEAAAIETALRHRARATLTKAWIALGCGVPLCFLGPVILGSIFWMAALFGLRKWTPWLWWFGGVSILGIPSAFRLEIRSRGKFLDETLAEAAAHDSDVMGRLTSVTMLYGAGWGLLGSLGADPGLTTAGFVEFFLSGPRLVLWGLRTIRAGRSGGVIDWGRAAKVVAFLLSRQDGVEPAALLTGGERMAELSPVLLWLAGQGWLGVVATGDRVFLYSESRRVLTEGRR